MKDGIAMKRITGIMVIILFVVISAGCRLNFADSLNTKPETQTEIPAQATENPQLGPSSTNPEIQADIEYSLYCSPNTDYTYYLGFYPDHTVISVSSTGNSEKVVKWFNKKYTAKGVYKIDNDQISFTVTSSTGSVDFHGSINGRELDLYSHSKINGYDSHEIYKYVGNLKKDGSIADDLSSNILKLHE